MQALVLHFPLNMPAPRLLAHQAASTTAVNHLERRQVFRMVVESDEASRSQQFENFKPAVLNHCRGGALITVATGQVIAGWLTGGHVLAGGLD